MVNDFYSPGEIYAFYGHQDHRELTLKVVLMHQDSQNILLDAMRWEQVALKLSLLYAKPKRKKDDFSSLKPS